MIDARDLPPVQSARCLQTSCLEATGAIQQHLAMPLAFVPLSADSLWIEESSVLPA